MRETWYKHCGHVAHAAPNLCNPLMRQHDTPNRAASMLTPCGHSREQTKANHMWTRFELVIFHPSKIVLSQFITSFKYWLSEIGTILLVPMQTQTID